MDFDWTEIFEKYKGKWVALMDDEKTVIGNGTSAKAALEDAENNGYTDPILFHVLGISLENGEKKRG